MHEATRIADVKRIPDVAEVILARTETHKYYCRRDTARYPYLHMRSH